MSKHTPGPWAQNEDRVESANEHGWINDGWIVAGCAGPDAYANARLIAAAPEMLEALREAECALSLMHSYGHCEADSYTGARDVAQVRAGDALDKVSAAIAKATGEQQ